MKRSAQAGFSLIEMLVVITIIGVLSGVGIASYNNFNNRQKLVQDRNDLITFIRKVKKAADVGERSPTCSGTLDNYEITFTGSFYINAYQNCSVSGRELYDRFTASTNVGPGSIVYFYPLSAGTSLTSPLTLSLGTESLILDSGGNISEGP